MCNKKDHLSGSAASNLIISFKISLVSPKDFAWGQRNINGVPFKLLLETATAICVQGILA